MSKLPISNLADITVNLIGAAQAVDSFGVPCIIDTQNVLGAGDPITPVVKTCYSLQDLLDLGFATDDKAYVLALHLLSYSPKRVKSFVVASVSTLSSAALTAVESANANWYVMLVTSRASADLQTCATWCETTATRRHVFFGETQDSEAFGTGASVLSILENSNRTRSLVMARKADAQELTFTISNAYVALNSVSFNVNGTAVGPVVYAVDSDSTLAAVASAITATVPTIVASATVTSGGAGTDVDREIVIKAADPLIPVQITDYECTLGGSQNTVAIVETNPGAGAADAELAGLLIPQGLGQLTAAGKNLAGLNTDDLSQTEYSNVTGHGGNCFVTFGVYPMVQKGQTSGFVAPGAHCFADTIFVRDRLEADLQNALLGVLANSGKIPFNNSGIAAVAGALINTCNQYVTKQMLEPFDVAKDWTIPDISEVDPADKTARHLAGITANLTGTGAIQSIAMTVNITV